MPSNRTPILRLPILVVLLTSARTCWLVTLSVAAGWAAEPAATAPAAADRLGFHFDQRIHDGAQKKVGAARNFDSEPVPAGVERLPRYVVKDRPIDIPEHQLLTPKGRDAVAKQRYLSPLYQKTLGPLAAVAALLTNPLGGWNPNSAEASALYEQDEDIRRMNDAKDLNDLARLADSVKDTGNKTTANKGSGKP